MRVGFGYDVHKLIENRKLVLGGVQVPFEKGLMAHSDGDVLIHAIIDALLGSIVKGDIGKLFPDKDVKYKDIDSRILLEKVNDVLKEDNYKIINIDSTIVAQKPKLSPYVDNMRQNISETLNIEIGQVSVKCTTTEGLGFTGTGDGIAAYAVVYVENAN